MGKRLTIKDIRVISYVHVGEELVNTEELTEEQRRRMATELAAEWLNGLFRGQAVFRPAGSEE